MPEEAKSEFNPDILQDMLPIYYKRLFPHKQFYRWLSYKLCEFSVCNQNKQAKCVFPPKISNVKC